jgi:NADPH:quinone reductase-like Zn-dependent oxidoreductase
MEGFSSDYSRIVPLLSLSHCASMRAITISSFRSQPIFTAGHPPPCDVRDDQVAIRFLASGLHPLVRAQAAGTRHSAKTKSLPYVLGVDGIGITSDGRTVYFNSIMSSGDFTEKISISKTLLTPVPIGAEPTQLAGLVNLALGAWMAFKGHTSSELEPRFNLLIIGVTGSLVD